MTAREAVATLGRAGLVPGGAFVHPLVAAGAYADMGVRERAAAHVRAADACPPGPPRGRSWRRTC